MIQVSIVIPYFQRDKNLFLWMQRRESKDSLQGMLEFPGGKIEENESELTAAIREVKEEVGIKLKEESTKLVLRHRTDFVILNIFLNNEIDIWPETGWIKISSEFVKELEIPPENKIFLPKIIEIVKSTT